MNEFPKFEFDLFGEFLTVLRDDALYDIEFWDGDFLLEFDDLGNLILVNMLPGEDYWNKII